MLAIQVNGDAVSADELQAVKASLIEHAKASTNPPISSLYLQSYSGVSNRGTRSRAAHMRTHMFMLRSPVCWRARARVCVCVVCVVCSSS
jgi:hypothetical protein